MLQLYKIDTQDDTTIEKQLFKTLEAHKGSGNYFDRVIVKSNNTILIGSSSDDKAKENAGSVSLFYLDTNQE